jgi:transposase
MKRGPGRRVPGKAEKPKADWKALDIMHPDAAGIDIGGSEHWVAISPERDPEPVRCFDCFTADVERMADCLIDRGVRSVAMQSTGVYWIPVFEILQTAGTGGVSGECAAHQESARP